MGKNEPGHWADGMVLTLSGHVVPMFVLFQPNVLPQLGTANPFGVYVPLRPFMMVPGIAQLVWLIPIALWAWGTGRRDTLIGALVTGGAVFLLNTACWAVVVFTR